MLPEPRAVVFDMDDTLYPYRRFKLSGFRAVAEHLARRHAQDRDAAFLALARATRGDTAGRELQACLAQLALPRRLLPGLLQVFEQHVPDIRLPRATRRSLHALRLQGWRLGVLTNGPAERQMRRVRALDLHRLTDAVLYAECHGYGAGKPDPAAFHAAASALDTPPAHCVFVGDDELCDVRGALIAGMKPVRSVVWRPLVDPTDAPVVLRRLRDLPDIAAHLLDDGVRHHAVA